MTLERKQFLIDIIDPVILARVHPSIIPSLEGTVIPRHAFAVVGIPKRRRRRDPATRKQTIDLILAPATINLEDQPAQKYTVNDYVFNKNGKVLCYGNFPTHNDADKKRHDKYKLYSEPNGMNPWDDMASYLDTFLGRESEVHAEVTQVKATLQAEIDALKAQLQQQAVLSQEDKEAPVLATRAVKPEAKK